MRRPFGDDESEEKKMEASASKGDISLAWQPGANKSQSKNSRDANSFEDGQLGLPEINGNIDNSVTLKFRAPRPKKRNWGKIAQKILAVLLVVILVVGTFIFSLRFNRSFGQGFANFCVELAKSSQDYGLPDEVSNIFKKVALQTSKIGKKNRPIPRESTELVGCSQTVERVLSKKVKENLSGLDYYLLGSCLLVFDRVALVKEYIKLDNSSWGRVGVWSQELILESIIRLELMRRIDPFSYRKPNFTESCPHWQVDPNCYLRLLEEARQPIKLDSESGYQILEQRIGKEQLHLLGWMYFSGGLIASKDGLFNKAEMRFRKSNRIAALVKDSYLKREVFRARVKNIWMANDKSALEKVWSQFPEDVYKEDSSAFLDVELLRSVLLPNSDPKSLIASYLQRPESYMRYTDDQRFVDHIIFLALKYRENSHLYSYLKKIESQNIVTSESEHFKDWLNIAMVRALYADNHASKITQRLKSLSSHARRTSEIEHLVGLIRLKNRSENDALRLASENFIHAIRLGASSEGSFALIVLYLEARDIPAAEEAMARWKARQKGESVWQIFAEGLIQYAKNEYKKALQIWTSQQEKDKGLYFIQVLVHNLREDPHYMQGRIYEVLSQILPAESPLGSLALFHQKS